MRKYFILLCLLTTISSLFLLTKEEKTLPIIVHSEFSKLPVSDENYQTAIAIGYYSKTPPENLEDIQCPIPRECRVPNYTGVQCVFSSLECLARWAECKELLEPTPLTSRPGCKSYSSGSDASQKLKNFGVRFENAENKKEGLVLIKKAMKDGRGCLWGVPGHAMVLCHYDEEKNVVKWIDNSDRNLNIQTTTVAKFNQRWDGWVMIIYANPDLFPDKIMRLANQIPIIDKNNPQGVYPKNYIPTPKRR